MPKRYKIRFPDDDSYRAAQAEIHLEGPEAMFRSPKGRVIGQSLVHVKNDKRHYVSIEPSSFLAEGESEKKFEMQLENFDKHFGARIVEDFRYDWRMTFSFPARLGRMILTIPRSTMS